MRETDKKWTMSNAQSGLLYNKKQNKVRTANTNKNRNIRGFILACTNKSEKTCLEKLVFCTNKAYGNKVLAIKKSDYVFLYNTETDVLFGGFVANDDGFFDKNTKIFDGKYPYQVRVKLVSGLNPFVLHEAKNVFKKMGINWRDILTKQGAGVLLSIMRGKIKLERVKENKNFKDKFYIPPIFSTTLWDFPKQSYGDTPKGNNKYPGVTPAFIIYNMIYRYTEIGDTILDPMAGSGTTIDVCKAEKRKAIGFDLAPIRDDILQGDARNLPLSDESVDMIFIDSPYGNNIKYNEHPDNIGHISATDEKFYDELEKVMKESFRVLKKGKVLGWLIGDQWAKKTFVPVGLKIYQRLTKYFIPVDIICIVRRNQASNTPFWHSKALQYNFYLRGFKYLIIVRKPDGKELNNKNQTETKWRFYER